MLDGASSPCHELGTGPHAHSVERVLIQMALDKVSRRRRALRLEGTARAIGRYIGHVALLPVQLLANQCAAGRAAECVALRLIDEDGSIKQRAVGLVVDGAVSRNAGRDAIRFAGGRMCAVGKAGIGNNRQLDAPENIPVSASTAVWML